MYHENAYSILECEHAFHMYIDLCSMNFHTSYEYVNSIFMTDQPYFKDVYDSNGHAYHDCKNSIGMIEYAQQLEIEFKMYKIFA